MIRILNKVVIMLRNSILAITLVAVLSGCASDKPVLHGVDGNEIPPAFAHFPDVPFPEKAYVDLDQTKALGAATIGSASGF